MNLPKKEKSKYDRAEKLHKKKIDKENKKHEKMHDVEMDKAFEYGKGKCKKKKK